MRILYCWGHCTDKGDVRRTVLDQAGDNFTAGKRDKSISGNMGAVGAEGVFEERGIMAAYAKDEEITRIADNSVLEFVIRNLGKKLV
jgi:hypothetical protein